MVLIHIETILNPVNPVACDFVPTQFGAGLSFKDIEEGLTPKQGEMKTVA